MSYAAFKMCKGKRKMKSSEAGRLAARFGQRKYECPICGHWHLTTSNVKPKKGER